MSGRPHIVLRDASRDDAAALVSLWTECTGADAVDHVDAAASGGPWREPGVAEAASALEANLAVPGHRIIVALVDDEIVGATACSVSTLTPVTLTKVLVVTQMQVSPRFRRRSVASTLLSAAATHGEEHGCEIVIASIPTQAREPHRYLTKLGFTQIAVLRAIQTSKLRSRLASRTTNSRDTGKLIAVRRTLRRRQGDSDASSLHG